MVATSLLLRKRSLEMRSILTLLVCLGLLTATAQPPQLGPDQFFQVGHSYLRSSYDIHPDTAASLIGAVGTFYSINLGWLPDAVLYSSDSIACHTAPSSYVFHSEYYDTANVQLTITDLTLGGVREHLFLVDDQRVQYVGGQPNGSGGTGDDLVTQRYPLNGFETVLRPDIVYGSTWTDTINGQFYDGSGSDEHYITGLATTVADAAGEITLPDGSLLPHTLRLRTVRAYLDSNVVFGNTLRRDTLYTWWVDSWDAPLMTLPLGYYAMMNGYVSPLPFTFYQRLGIAQSISEPVTGELPMSPNPCSTILHIGGAPGTTPYSIIDTSGRVVGTGVLSTAHELDVSGLPNGSYVVRVDGDVRPAGRFTVAR